MMDKLCRNCRFGIETDIQVLHWDSFYEDYPKDPEYKVYEIIHCKNLKRFKEHLELAQREFSDDPEISPDFSMFVTANSLGCEYHEMVPLYSGVISRLWPREGI